MPAHRRVIGGEAALTSGPITDPGRAVGTDATLPAVAIDDAWFAAPVCRNCGAARTTPFCPRCGQKAATRFVWHDIRTETWDRLRLFEIKSVRTIGRLILSPGTVARDYVLGRRTAHMHPLTLLIALVAILVLELAANRYFETYGFARPDGDVDRMARQVMAYANWSFSLGIFAIFFGSWAVFRHRLGTNIVEHAIMAIYAQSLILALIIVNLLPTLIWHDSGFILWHKAASQYYISAAKLLIVAVAYRQFFLLQLKTDWPRLAAACLLYAGIGWLLLRAYAFAILWIVTGQS